MESEAGWCCAQLSCTCSLLILRFGSAFWSLIPMSIFLSHWLLTAAWDTSSCWRNSPRPKAASPFVLCLPWSHFFTCCQNCLANMKWFNVAYKMSSMQFYVKWEKYASTENYPWKISMARFFFYKHRPYCTQEKYWGSFCFQFLYSYEAWLFHTGPLRFCKTPDKAADGDRKRRSEASEVNL